MKFKILLIVLSVDDNRQMSVYLFLFFLWIIQVFYL